MTRVLVTGAGGFVGRHTLAPLAAAGLEVHAVTSSEPPSGVPAEARWHRADLLEPGSATALLHAVRPSHLLHLAWYTEPGAYWTAPENLDWVAASLRLLRAFGDAGGRRAVLAGTCAEYRWRRRTHCVELATPAATSAISCPTALGRAGTPLLPDTLYGAAKHGLHVVADAWARQAGVELAWGRIFHVYGPHEHPDRFVAGLARALLRGEAAPCSHGRQRRDLLYVPELGAAFAALLASVVAGPVNMASGEPTRLAELALAIGDAAGRPELVRLGAQPPRPGEPDSLTADVQRLRDEVGWAPSVGIREGVAHTVDWWRRASAAEPGQVRAGAGTR